jgi:predicted glycoside hydrolase/deacetylase ChbG (UPF0249 family)
MLTAWSLSPPVLTFISEQEQMNRNFITVILTAAILAPFAVTFAQSDPRASGQSPSKSLLQRLGYPDDQKLLIVHGDDLGVAHSVNRATIRALESGGISSASIMIPCPWLPEIAAYARTHPQADLGLHLTLTSEWRPLRWAPVLGRELVPTLIDPDGYLYPSESEAATHINVREAENEIRAQIARAKALGFQPTHVDSHMGTLYQNQALFEVLMRVARENRLPVRLSKEWFGRVHPFMPSVLGPDDIVADRIISIEPDVSAENWARYYVDEIKRLQPGLTVMIVHLAYNDEEMQGITSEHPNWGAAWRQRDFDFVTSDAFRRVLEENHVKLITWREVGRLLKS